MIKIGKYNKLKIAREVDFGLYLEGEKGESVLLPRRYVTSDMGIGMEVEVFVYNDSEDRLIATTEHPYATVDEFAFLQVTAVNHIGAFLDWGLKKDLLVPFREQKIKMKQGGVYPVYVYLDDASKRVVASGKFEKFIGNRFPEYNHGAEVEIIPYSHTEIGYKAIVDNLYFGMLYDNEVFRPVVIGEKQKAWVKQVREDGKIDLLAVPAEKDRVELLAEDIMKAMHSYGGIVNLSDKSSPELIKESFGCSKKDFKKAIGLLYKRHDIEILPECIKLVPGR